MKVLSDYVTDPENEDTLIPRVCLEYGVKSFTSEPYSLEPEIRIITIDDGYGEILDGYEVV